MFQIKNSAPFQAAKTAGFPLFQFSKFFKDLVLILLSFSIVAMAFALIGSASIYITVKMFVFFLAFYILFWNISFFTEVKIKKPEIPLDISGALSNPDASNLADFLTFEAANIVLGALGFCKKRNIPVNSTALFYSCVKNSKDINLICFRLGLNTSQLPLDIKNYLEKTNKDSDLNGFSDDFEKVILTALQVAVEKQNSVIGEKEIFVALAKENEFFKKLLIDCDLKPADVENLTFWLDSAEKLIQKSKQFWTLENLLKKGSLGKDFSSGYTITLDRFSVDWQKIASRWTFRQIIGHKREIEEVETILAKSELANALIVGEPGTGRKSIVQAIAQRCFLGTSLEPLNNKRVVELDPVLLAAQIPDFERLEQELDQICQEALNAGNVIMVIDNLENFVGQKVQKAGAFDISAILSKYLIIPSFQFIGITTFEGLHKNIEESRSFCEMFQKVEVTEISETETINTLQTAALELEFKNKILILYPSIREIVNLSGRYIPSMPFPKKALDILNESAAYVLKLREKVVLPHHIAEIISKKTDIPVGKMEVKEKETLLNLENLIHQRIVNQQEAVKEISIAMRRARAGIASKTRPMGTFLFLGPTGVGKTETAKALSQIYFGSESKMIRLDMSEFQEISDIARLIGATSPVEMQGLLTTPVRERPFSLLLLDEIEKAHPNILNLFLQVLDEGHITDGQGRKVVFTNTIIICTSNACADLIFKAVEAREELNKNKLLDSLFERQLFRPEFVNRFDATVIFHPLTKENLLQIAQLSLQSLKKNLKEKEIDFEITEPLKEKIVELSYKPEFGAREMRRVIQDNVESAVAQALLADKIKKGDVIQIDENFKMIINGIDTVLESDKVKI